MVGRYSREKPQKLVKKKSKKTRYLDVDVENQHSESRDEDSESGMSERSTPVHLPSLEEAKSGSQMHQDMLLEELHKQREYLDTGDESKRLLVGESPTISKC